MCVDLENADDIELIDDGEVSTDESLDSDDEKGPENVDNDDNFVLPKEYTQLDEPPFDFSVKNLKRLRVRIALKWPYGTEWGWEIGTFQRLQQKGRWRNHFVMRWEDGKESYLPKPARAEYGRTKQWVLLVPV